MFYATYAFATTSVILAFSSVPARPVPHTVKPVTSLIHLEDLLDGAKFTLPSLEGRQRHERISFEFDEGSDGWSTSSGASLSAEDGILKLTGSRRMKLKSREPLKMGAEEVSHVKFRARSVDVDSMKMSWVAATAEGVSKQSSEIFQIKPDGQWHEYLLPTNVLSGWEGGLANVSFESESVPDDFTIELDFVRLILKTPKTRTVEVEHAWASKTLRNAIHMVTPCKIEFDVELPDDARFTFGTRVTSAQRPISLEITVHHDGGLETVFSATKSNNRVWKDHTVDLSRWSGRNIRLDLSCEGEKKFDILYLANPCIYTPGEESLNVIVYLIDALRPDRMSAYGYERDTTPNIDALLDHAMVFNHAYSTAPRTAESVPAIMTSLPTMVHGVRGQRSWLSPEKPVLQEVLKNHGYTTASFITNVWAGPKSGLDRGFDFLFDDIAGMREEDSYRTLPDEIHTWLERNADKPFFIYVHTAEPHAPYGAPPPFERMYVSGDAKGKPVPPRFGPRMKEEELQATKDLYDGEVRYADDSFGKLVTTLQKLGVYDDTVILVLADHGEEFYEHGKSRHGAQLYIESIRIPFIFIGKQLPGVPDRTDAPVSTLDIMPTILDLVGAEGPEIMFGRPLFDEDGLADIDFERPIVAEHSKPTLKMETLIKGDWKLLKWEYPKSVARYELYDLSRDYGETEEVDDEDKTAEMRDLLNEIMLTYQGMESAGEEFEEIDIETMERLRSLGYIE